MTIGKLKIVFALQCSVIMYVSQSDAEPASETTPKYCLYQNVPHNSAGGCALVNAKWWEDESGNKGSEGAVPDPSGDYYTKAFTLDTRNEMQGATVPFACNALHIGEVGASSARLNIYTSDRSVFKVLGKGLFLHRGFSQLNWKPITIDGNVTVDSPADSPFSIYDRFCNTVLNIPAAMHSGREAVLWFYANSEEGQSGSRTFVVKVTGDCSDYLGCVRIGKDSNALGRNTCFYPPEGGFAGTIAVKATGSLVVEKDVVVGGASFENGSRIVSNNGCLVVTNSFAVSGRVNLDICLDGRTLPNVANDRIRLLSVPADSSLSADDFTVSLVDGDSGCDRIKSTVISVEDEADGGKTLYATFTRRSVYVSPNGDDGNSGTDERNPFRTLAHAVSVISDGIVYAMPGVYSEGVCDDSVSTARSRVRIPGQVYLKSLAGAFETTICGVLPENADGHDGRNLRCAVLDDGAVIEGFTLTGGYANGSSADAFRECAGGGVYAQRHSVIADCRILANTARRGGGGYGGIYIRCVFDSNTASHGSWSGSDLFGGNSALINPIRCFDCVFGTEGYDGTPVYQAVDCWNCTFVSGTGNGPNHTCNLYNCLILTMGNLSCANNTRFYSCLLATAPSGDATLAADCKIADLSGFIGDGYRLLADSPAIDFGKRELYIAGWEAAEIDRVFMDGDLNGSQRVYNGRIDCGAVEYDWRGDYTDIVGKRRLEVVQATENVELNGDEMLKLVDGAKLVIDWNSSNGGVGLRMKCGTFVSGTGMLSVCMDGDTIAEVIEGESSVTWKSTKDSHVLVFSYSGEGEAIVGPFENKNGFKVRIR